MNIEDLLVNVVKEKIENGDFKAKIEAHVDNYIQTILRDVLCSYGGVAQELKKKIENSLVASLHKVSIEAQSEFIITTIGNALLKEQEPMKDVITKKIEKIFKKPPSEFNLSTFIKEYFTDGLDGNWEITFIDECSDYGGVHIYFDEEPRKSKERCDHQMSVSETGNIYWYKNKESSYGVRDAYQMAMNGDMLGTFIHKMMMHNTKLILDIDDVVKERDYN